MTNTLVSDDPRYREMFDVAKEAASSGGHVFGDLTPAMNALRDKGPVHKGSLQELLHLPEVHAQYDRPREHYTLLTFEACNRAFRENLVFSSEVYRESPGVQQMGHTILAMVGEEHRRYRSMVQPMFIRPKAIKWWKPRWIEEAVDTLLDRLVERDGADLNLELCARLPVYIVTRGMGLDGEDALNFRTSLLRATTGARSLTREEAANAMNEVARMLRKVINARRGEPGDDVITGLVQCDLALPEGGSRKLTDEEIFSYARLIMNAGGGTTWRQLGITLSALLQNYQFWEACREDRKLLEPAINEGARWLPTDPTFPRLLTQDVELGGVTLPKEARVDLCLGAANRDPARWENPDVYDLFRPFQHHLGFGMGPHRCLGMEVALQEMISALNGLMDRFPMMRLDANAPAPQILGGLHQRGMSAVPVRFR